MSPVGPKPGPRACCMWSPGDAHTRRSAEKGSKKSSTSKGKKRLKRVLKMHFPVTQTAAKRTKNVSMDTRAADFEGSVENRAATLLF